MSYIVDISQENVKKAISFLGIDIEDLLLKKTEDYSDKDTMPDIRRMRFTFIRRKQNELARRIKEYLSENTFKQTEPLSTVLEYSEQPQVGRKSPSPILKVKRKQKEMIEKHLAALQNNIKTTKDLEKRLNEGERHRESIKNSIFNKRKSKFVSLEGRNTEKPQTRSVTSVKMRPISDLPAKIVAFEHTSQKTRRYSENPDQDILEKMQKFEEKMGKSEKLKAIYTKSVKESASKLLERVVDLTQRLKPSEDLETDSKAWKFIQKVKKIKNSRLKLQKIRTESRVRQQKIDAERHSKTQAKQEQFERDLNEKIQKIMEKESKFELKTSENEEKKHKVLALNNELKKLKEEEIQKNLARKKKAQYLILRMFRSGLILEQQILDNKRIQQIRSERDEEVCKNLEIARRLMIQKERYYQTIMEINRSSESKIMQLGRSGSFER